MHASFSAPTINAVFCYLDVKFSIIEFKYFRRILDHRLSINRPTKRGKDKSSSDGHCQCEKEIDDHLLACQKIIEREPHSDTTRYRASIIFEN
jgi:hypothetical protein